MNIGKGRLILRDGRGIAVEYQFGSDYDDSRTGYLRCDTSCFDPGEFGHKLTLQCEDEATVVLAVVHYSDRYLAVTGRLLAVTEEAA